MAASRTSSGGIVNLERVMAGSWPTDWLSVTPPTNFDTITLLIPGNPGIVNYYTQFCQDLYEQLHQQSAVWAVSHSCHTEQGSIPYSTVKREIEHKISFIRKFVPREPKYKLRLIGHSIGCQMIMKALDKLVDSESIEGHTTTVNDTLHCDLGNCYMIFPTIERMKDTPQGRRVWPILHYFWWLPPFLGSCVSILPQFIKQKLVRLFFYDGSGLSLENSVVESVVCNTLPDMTRNMMDLAYNELEEVTELDTAAITRHKDRLVFYYGTSDDWCPVQYREEMMQRVPGVMSYLCQRAIDHAFVLRKSTVMAYELAKIIKEVEDLQLVEENDS